MSTKRGNVKKGAQKHQNRVAFKAHKYNIPAKPLGKAIAAPIHSVCQRCRDKIEWRKKYNKYKPLSAPATCVKCKKKTVKAAYHAMCNPCGRSLRLCCKCGTPAETEDSPLTPAQIQQKEAEEMMQFRGMKERERRTYLRKLEAEKELEKQARKDARREAGEEEESDEEGEDKGAARVPETDSKLDSLAEVNEQDEEKDPNDSEYDSDDLF